MKTVKNNKSINNKDQSDEAQKQVNDQNVIRKSDVIDNVDDLVDFLDICAEL